MTTGDANAFSAINLEIFRHLFSAIPEEMGAALCRSAYSSNIKERRDFSCALFDGRGQMIAQAAHIPVHLGAMPASVAAALNETAEWRPGDCVILNDPYRGGSHLPDITLVSPVFTAPGGGRMKEGTMPDFFVASRAHHADVGGMAPGSMPIAREIYQEGVIIPPLKLVREGQINQDLLKLILRNVRTPEERRGDLEAQWAAHRVAEQRLRALVARQGITQMREHAAALLDYAERRTRAALQALPDGEYRFQDTLETGDDPPRELPISVRLQVRGDELHADFTGTAEQYPGPLNCPLAVTESAVLYVVYCLVGSAEGLRGAEGQQHGAEGLHGVRADRAEAPNNAGLARPVHIAAPPGCLLNAAPPASVAGGNVETSQRVVDVVLGALAQAAPAWAPAAGQGTMNNLSFGGQRLDGRSFAYYETLGGGGGAYPEGPGIDGRHVHMSNTRNTPVEALESELPLRVRCYQLRSEAAGKGRQRGGAGVVREIEFLVSVQLSLLTQRRVRGPWGRAGGGDGLPGRNTLIRVDGGQEALRGQDARLLEAGDAIRIETPGGGGWGA